MRPRSLRKASQGPIPHYVFVWANFRTFTISYDLIGDVGERLDSFVEQSQRAATVIRAVPKVVIQGGLWGKAGLLHRALAAHRVGRSDKVSRVIEALPEVEACVVSGRLDRRRALAMQKSHRVGLGGGACRFGCGLTEGDRQSHYLVSLMARTFTV